MPAGAEIAPVLGRELEEAALIMTSASDLAFALPSAPPEDSGLGS
jgi:hypothetical protein